MTTSPSGPHKKSGFFYFPQRPELDRSLNKKGDNLFRRVLLSTSIAFALIMGMASCSGETSPKQPDPAAPASTPVPIQIYTHKQILPSTPIAAPTSIPVIKEIESQRSPKGRIVRYFPAPSPPTYEKLTAQFPLTVIARNGSEMIFDKPPERIIAYDAAAVETIFAIGQGHRIIGTHSWVSHPAEVEDIEKVGDAFNMNIERILDLDPDLVFLFSPTFKEELEKAGLRVLLLESVDDDLMGMANTFRTWGQITGAVNEAEILAENFESRITEIKLILDPYHSGPSVFQDVGDLWTPGNNTLMGSVFQLLKLENMAHDVDNYGQLSPEVIIDRNPQIIISSTPDLLYNNPAFSKLLPIKNKSIFESNDDYLSISGPRFILGLEELANEFYPGLFK